MANDSFGKIMSAVFLVVDIILLLTLVRMRKEYVRTSVMYLERQGRIEECLEDFVNVDQGKIRDLLDEQNIIQDYSPQLFMIIPSYPCSACLDRESAFFKDFAGTDLVKCHILVPDYRLKDTRALFSGASNITINSFEPETMNDEYWKQSEKIIYFLLNEGTITNIMVTSKYSDIASEYYLEHIREVLGYN